MAISLFKSISGANKGQKCVVLSLFANINIFTPYETKAPGDPGSGITIGY